MKIIIIIFLSYLSGSFSVTAQMHKSKIISSFDTIIYYPDSTIKEAAHLKNHRLHGYAVRFDTLGNPDLIGEYKKGKEDGNWKMRNGCFQSYSKGESSIVGCPGCGTGIMEASQEFRELYLQLTGIDLRRKKEKDRNIHLE